MIQKAVLFSISFLLACSTAGAQEDVILKGAGATFPYPLYKKLIEVYQSQNGVRVAYEALGSGGGIRQLIDESVDFGATDAILSDQELAEAPGRIQHVPTCVGAVVITYNLPGGHQLKFTPDLVAAVFMGTVTRWSDRRIRELNPDVSFPDTEITVVHRSDASGTTFIFSDYLSKVSEEWKSKIGRGKTVRWPVGAGVEGNAGMAEFIKKVNGSIGYTELTYAEHNSLPTAAVKNRSGRYIKPTLESVSAAADVALPDDTRLLITDTAIPAGYPISAFTYLIFYQEQAHGGKTIERACALVRFLWWIIHKGQYYNTHLLYAPLPKKAVMKAESIIRSITYQDTPITCSGSSE